ncbi:hypothetical protein [Pseudoduganella sp. RAF53_2]
MASLQPLWWFALPVLLLPIWWHMQKRERVKTELLATARFLPAAAPQQQRVPRWIELLLLVLRLLLLITLIAWLAVTTIPWRGDTVLIEAPLESSEPAWVVQQVAAAGMTQAARLPLPADALSWLAHHEHEWRPGARLLILASQLPMPAEPPRLSHPLDIRTAPAPASSAAHPASTAASAAALPAHAIVVATTDARRPQWQAVFAAFGTSAAGRYQLQQAPTSDTELIVWDRPEAPPANWHAPLWWRSGAAAANALTINGLRMHIADAPQGRIWTAPDWLPANESSAAALYETWQQLARPTPAYPMPQYASRPTRSAPLPLPGVSPAQWLAWALLALFAIERILTHVRRR